MNALLFDTLYPFLWLYVRLWSRWLILREPRHIRRKVVERIRTRQAQGKTLNLYDVRFEIEIETVKRLDKQTP